MKDGLLIATLAVTAFLATLTLGGVRADWWRNPAPTPARAQAPLSAPPVTATIAAPPLASAPTESAAASAPESVAPEAPALAEPTYEQQSETRDRAAAHGARSR